MQLLSTTGDTAVEGSSFVLNCSTHSREVCDTIAFMTPNQIAYKVLFEERVSIEIVTMYANVMDTF